MTLAPFFLRVFFADPYAPWQRGSNENANGLIREYLPKGTDLGIPKQRDLDRIADRLNGRPRKVLDFRTPLEVMEEILTGHAKSILAARRATAPRRRRAA
jgi:IS30 family transposase